MKIYLVAFITSFFLSNTHISYSMNEALNQADTRREEIFKTKKKRAQHADLVNRWTRHAQYCTYTFATLAFIGFKIYVSDFPSALKFMVGITPGIVISVYTHQKASVLKDAYNAGQDLGT